MFLDDEIASTRTGRNEARWGVYLALAALAVCMVMIFGLVVETTAEAAPRRPEQQSATLVDVEPEVVLGGERQIAVGATLLAAALTAATTFVVGNRIAAMSRARSRRHGR